MKAAQETMEGIVARAFDGASERLSGGKGALLASLAVAGLLIAGWDSLFLPNRLASSEDVAATATRLEAMGNCGDNALSQLGTELGADAITASALKQRIREANRCLTRIAQAEAMAAAVGQPASDVTGTQG